MQKISCIWASAVLATMVTAVSADQRTRRGESSVDRREVFREAYLNVVQATPVSRTAPTASLATAAVPNLDFFPSVVLPANKKTMLANKPAEVKMADPVFTKSADPAVQPAKVASAEKPSVQQTSLSSVDAMAPPKLPTATPALVAPSAPLARGEPLKAQLPAPGASLMPLEEIPTEPGKRKEFGRRMLADARRMLAQGQVEDAEGMLYRLQELAIEFGRFGDNPERLREDITQARRKKTGGALLPEFFEKKS